MTARTNGAEFKAYYNDKKYWPEGWWHEDAIITIDGVHYDGTADLGALNDDAILTIAGGGIYKDYGSPLQISMETHFTRWLESQKKERVVVDVDNASKAEFL